MRQVSKSLSILRFVACNRPLSPLFRGSILAYLPGFTLLMGAYFARQTAEGISLKRFNINDLITATKDHFALFVFQVSRSAADIYVGHKGVLSGSARSAFEGDELGSLDLVI